MVVQGKGGWKGSNTSKDKNNNSGKHPAAAKSPNRGGAHTLSDLPADDHSPQQGQNGYTAQRSSSVDESMIGFATPSDATDEKIIPEYSGRPPTGGRPSFREMFFPWYKLLSVTSIICAINWAYFIVELIYGGVHYTPQQAFVSGNRMGGPSSLVLRDLGGKYTPWIEDGHVWRLLVPVIMHSGILHILLNTYFLLRFGFICEARYGTPKMLGGYIYAGIMGNVYSTILSKSGVSVGASGALFGVMCMNLYFVIRHFKLLQQATCEIIIIAFILIFNFLMGFLGGDGTDNAAHLFGAASGFLIANCIMPLWRTDVSPKKERLWKVAACIFVLAYTGVSFALIWITKK